MGMRLVSKTQLCSELAGSVDTCSVSPYLYPVPKNCFTDFPTLETCESCMDSGCPALLPLSHGALGSCG